MCSPSQQDLYLLLEVFEKKPFEAACCVQGTPEYAIAQICQYLFKKDYSIFELDNPNGNFSARYPRRIFIPEYEHGHMAKTLIPENVVVDDGGGSSGTTASATPLASSAGSSCSSNNDLDAGIQAFVTFANPDQQQQPEMVENSPQQPAPQPQPQNTIYEDQYDLPKVRELLIAAKYARCRQRFAIPVIMFKGKYICRSATVSVLPEAYANYAKEGLSRATLSYQELIRCDVQLLKTLNVSTIIDLMVEHRKIKYFLPVSSSEKADVHQQYKDFNLLSLPYPGCEFFKKFRDNNYMAKNLHYDWNPKFNDAILNVPQLGPAADMDIIWHDYKDWDLVAITQNYLRATLKYIQEESGILIHCISGWDRTPLFISLLRMSLWADGLIHKSLTPFQMTYLTLAYDWYLFGHQLPDRLRRGEDIMFFCFHVLKFLVDDEFSLVEKEHTRRRTKTSSSSGSSVIVLKSDCGDEDLAKEDYVMALDQDSNDSFSNCDMPINDNFYATQTNRTAPQPAPSTAQSATSATSTSQAIPNPLTNRSPNSKRSRTSPISVPGASARQRQESTSSNGSWQVVTETGSIDSMVNGSYMSRYASQHHQHYDGSGSNIPTCQGNNGYHCTLLNGRCCSGGGSSGSGSASFGSASASCSGAGRSSSSNTHGHANGSCNHPGPCRPPMNLRKQRLTAVRSIFIQAYGRTIGLKFKEGSTMNLASLIGNLADQFF